MALDLSRPPAELALALVNIASVSGQEKLLADAVHLALAALPHLQLDREGNAIVARTDLGRARRVILAGHLDTVPVKQNLPGRLDEGVLWGRGSVDMKGGLAAMLSLASRLNNPVYDLTWVFYDQEEVAMALSGLGRLIDRRPELISGDFAILCEPTNGSIQGGCNGTLRAAVMAHGRAAHSARPWTGLNAIHALVPALERLAEFEAPSIRVDGLDYRESLNAVGLAGGTAPNVIPDRAVVTVNYRFAPDKSVDQAIQIVEAMFDGYTVTIEDAAPGARPGLDDRLAQRLVRAVAARGGAAPRAKLGWTDVARFGALGIPAVNLGPGDPELAHQDEEACPAGQIDQVAETLRLFLEGTA